jgi:hypothetical protein
VVAIPCCLCLRTVHALLRQGEGPLPREGGEQEGRKRLGQQPSHVTSGSARYRYDLKSVFRQYDEVNSKASQGDTDEEEIGTVGSSNV